jgi:nitrile hydratase accessory protein
MTTGKPFAVEQINYDDSGKVTFHDTCVADIEQPQFDADWQRRVFGLAVALSEFGHYGWQDFQQELITAIGSWQDAPANARDRWEYYEHWLTALTKVIGRHGLLEAGYINPEDRETNDPH